MDQPQFARGSEWRKWDLHVHSPLSILNNQFPKLEDGAPNWDAYLKALDATDISVLGVTDYFTIEGYKELRRQKCKGRLENIDLILPNIEFRLNEILYRGSDGKAPRRLNLHVIFSDKCRTSDIEDHFLHNLYFESRGNVYDKPFRERLKRSNLEELGRQLKAQLPDEHKGKSDIIVGAENATVSLEDIKNELTMSGRFDEKFIIVMDEENTSLIEWGKQDTQTRLTLLQNSHMVFSSNAKTRSWCLGRAPWKYGREQYIKAFNTLKPCIKGSDAHELFFIGHPCGRREQHECKQNPNDCDLRFCWIKADPTFEGLKQVLYEPEDRVRIQEKDPTASRYNYTLSSLTIDATIINDGLTIADTRIPVNRALVAVTGGRGTGKTALVDLVANCFAGAVKMQNDDSFVTRIGADSPKLSTTLGFTGAASFTKLVSESKRAITEADLAYISQGQLDGYITDNNELTKRIRELIFGEATEVLEYEFQGIESRIQEIENQLTDISSDVIALETQTSDARFVELQNKKSRLEVQLKDTRRQLEEIENSNADDDDVKRAQDAQKDLSRLRTELEALKELRTLVSEALAILDNEIQRFNSAIDAINRLIGSVGFDGHQCQTIEYDQEALVKLAAVVQRSITNTLESIDAIQQELKVRDEKVAQHASLLDQLSEGEKELKAVGKALTEFNSSKLELRETLAKRAIIVSQMLKSVSELRRKYLQIIEYFRDSAAVFQDLEFLAEIRFDRSAFIEHAKDLFDSRSINTVDYFSDTMQLFSMFASHPDEDSLEALRASIESHANSVVLRSKMKPNKSINLDDFFNVFYRNYFEVHPTVRYKGTPLDRLSLGQKATVLFKIYLAHGDYPVIVDSHDDYLDNEFIMMELIPSICEAKKRRQVILVSNNANVVVNADAEQIIIATHEEGNISYISGSLENPEIRQEALKVLEGGKEAFRRRQEKYRI